MSNNEQMLRELEEADVDELVELLNLTSKDLIKAFPRQVKEYLEELRDVDLEFPDADLIPNRGRAWDEYGGYDDDDDPLHVDDDEDDEK